MRMRAISLWQPWAYLVVAGHKGYETRSWPTNYRGPLAIHAAKRWTPEQRRFCGEYRLLVDFSKEDEPTLGAIVGRVNLIECLTTDELVDSLDFYERHFGDWSPGRFARQLPKTSYESACCAGEGRIGVNCSCEKRSINQRREKDMRYKGAIAAAFVLLMVTGVWAQETGGRLLDSPKTTITTTGSGGGGMDGFSQKVWEYNMKQLVESAFGRHERLNNLAELALQNTVQNANQQNVNATNWSNATASLARSASLFQGVTAGAGQGRQLTNADVSQGRTFATSDVAVGAIQSEVARAMTAMTPVLIDAVRALIPAVVEAVRNPPIGSGSTGQGLPAGPGERAPGE